MLQRNRLAILFGLAFVALTAPVHAASAFELLYPAANGVLPLPMPFGRLLDDLRQRSGGAEVQVAFVPLGRSLQRMAADPEFFDSPRIIAAVTRDGSTGPMLRNRLFIGYQPASGAIEIIAFDASKGRFVFQEVTQYEAGSVGAFTTHDEQGCIACHQSASPIFSASPWQETNANPAVVSALLPMYEGVNVTVDFDGLDRFDRAVRAAVRLQAAAQLWRQGCKTRVCRAALIGEALRMARSANTGDHQVKDRSFIEELAGNWPDGLSLTSSKLPDYDPLLRVRDGMTPAETVETSGILNPETPRVSETFWSNNSEGPQAAVQLAMELFDPDTLAEIANAKSGDQLEMAVDNLKGLAAGDAAAPMLDGALPDAGSLSQLVQQASRPGGSQ